MDENSNSKGKRIAKNTIMMYIRMFITMSVSLYTSRIVLNALGVENFGIYNVVGGMVSLFAFFNAAMMAATQRFINFELGKGNVTALSEVFRTSYLIHILIATLIVIIGCSLGKYFVEYKLQIPETKKIAGLYILYFSIATCGFQILTLPFQAAIISHEKINIYAWLSIFESVIRLLIAFLIGIYGDDRLVYYAALLMALQITMFFLNMLYCRSHFNEVKGKLKIYPTRLKEMGDFAIWALIGCTAGAFAGQGLNVLLGMFFTPIVNAARGIAVQVQSAINTFGSNLNTAMTPQITQSYSSGDYYFFFNILYRGTKYIFFLMALISVPIMLRTEYVLYLWLGEVPEYTVSFLHWIICATLIESMSFPLMRASDASGKIRLYHSVVGGILLLILPISYFVLKITDNPVAVFIVYFGIQFTAWFARLIILHRTIHLSVGKYIKDVIIRVIVIFILSIGISSYMTNGINNSISGLILICAITTIVTIIISYLIGLDKIEREFIGNKLKKIITKI